MESALADLAAMTSGSTDGGRLSSSPGMHSGGVTAQNAQNGSHGCRSCAGCGGRINDRFLLHAVDRYWHTDCLKCSCCQTPLADFNSCFAKAGMILCKNDYLRMIGSCGSCGQTIAANELVMKSQTSVYHVKCFACVTCHSQLVPGDRYSVVNGSILCEQDYPKVIKGHSSLPTRTNQKIQFPALV